MPINFVFQHFFNLLVFFATFRTWLNWRKWKAACRPAAGCAAGKNGMAVRLTLYQGTFILPESFLIFSRILLFHVSYIFLTITLLMSDNYPSYISSVICRHKGHKNMGTFIWISSWDSQNDNVQVDIRDYDEHKVGSEDIKFWATFWVELLLEKGQARPGVGADIRRGHTQGAQNWIPQNWMKQK